MKGFIAACLTKAQDYAKLPLKIPVHFAFTYDEETGCIYDPDICSVPLNFLSIPKGEGVVVSNSK